MRFVIVVLLALCACGCGDIIKKPPGGTSGERTPSARISQDEKDRIDRLIESMGDKNYKVREEASKNLRQLLLTFGKQSGKWKAAVRYVEEKSAETRDPEIAFRLNAILKPLRPLLYYKKYTKIHILTGHSEAVVSVAFSPDGKLLASASCDRTIRIWDTHTGKCPRVLRGHTDTVTSVVFSPDGKWLLSASHDGMVRIWDPHTNKKLEHPFAMISGGALLSVLVSPDGRLMAYTSVNDATVVFPFKTGPFIAGFDGGFMSAAFSPDSKLLATADNMDTIRIWDVNTHKCLQTLKQQTGLITSVAFSPDGKLLAVSNGVSFDNTKIRVWDVQTGNCLSTMQYKERRSEICSVVFVQNTNLLASGGTGPEVRIWDVSDGECIDVLPGHTEGGLSVASSSDGKLLASGGEDKTIIIWGIPEDGQKKEDKKQKEEEKESSLPEK